MTLALTGTSTVTQAIGLTPKDPRCSGSPLECRIAIVLVAGAYRVTLNAYDLAPVGGTIPPSAKLLSKAANVPFTVAVGKANTLGVTLDGIPKALSVSGLPSATAGTAINTPQKFAVTVKDADGDVIVGTYTTLVQVSDIDSSGATTLSSTPVAGEPIGALANSKDSVYLAYTGIAMNAVTITATATGATSGNASFAPALSPIGPATAANGVIVNTNAEFNAASFTVSEPGWTNSPYNHSLTVTPSGCDSIATIVPTGYTNSQFIAELVPGATTSGSCTVTFSDPFGQQLVVPIGYQWFNNTGASTYMVPSGIAQLTVFAAGAAGGSGSPSGSGDIGGMGGSIEATVPVTAGESLQVNVGGVGGAGGATTPGGGGVNGGAAGTYITYPTSYGGGGGGGGASDVREGGTTITPTDYRIVVAGGGGGGGGGDADGGLGGGATGGNGGCGGNYCTNGDGGSGGTPSAGGNGGTSGGGTAGTLGAGGLPSTNSGAGGGGGGYEGGGSGSGVGSVYFAGGGGGGSSYAEGTGTVVVNTQGNQSGGGYVLITY